MERLTYRRDADGRVCPNLKGGKDWLSHMKMVADKLCAYEDAEEQGFLIRLPCKVGDTVYRYSRLEQRMQALKCEGFLFNGICWKARCTDIIPSWVGNQKRHFYIMFSSFGKSAFLSREEAEAALAKEG